jgi:hypothetical protein
MKKWWTKHYRKAGWTEPINNEIKQHIPGEGTGKVAFLILVVMTVPACVLMYAALIWAVWMEDGVILLW